MLSLWIPSMLLKPRFGEFLTFFSKNAQAVVSSIRSVGYIFGSCLVGLLSFVLTPVYAWTCMRTTEMPQLYSSPLACCAHDFHNILSLCRVQGIRKLWVNIICFFPLVHSVLRNSNLSICPHTKENKVATLFSQTRRKFLF